MPAKSKTNQLQLHRVYDAPLKMVWDAWTDVEQVAKWWGPRGFTLTTYSKDLRPGGHWRYTMHGPDGVDYENTTIYHEVETARKLVYDHGGHEDRPPLFRVVVWFNEIEGRTHLDMTITLDTPEAAEQARLFIKQAGGDSTWDRLAEYLAHQSSGKQQFVINRSFECSPDVMFDLWTQPEHFARWLPPTGFEMQFHRADIRPGGSALFSMDNGAGMRFFGRVEYVQLERPSKLVYRQQFCDEQENVARHPGAPTWPETMLTTIELAAEGPEWTRVTVTWEPRGAVTPEELSAFIAERGGMTQGWTGSFDKLEELLEQAPVAQSSVTK